MPATRITSSRSTRVNVVAGRITVTLPGVGGPGQVGYRCPVTVDASDPTRETILFDDMDGAVAGAPPRWTAPLAWIGAMVLLLVASGGPVLWARSELAELTGRPEDDIWVQGLLVAAAGLVLAFSGAALDHLRHDRMALVATGVFLAVLLLTTLWSLDRTETVQQWILMAFVTAGALFGGAWLARTEVLTALFVALHVGIAISAFADLRTWPIAGGGGDLAGVYGTTDQMGMIALLAAATTVMLMVVILAPTPEERLARAEARAAGGGGFKMPSMRSFHQARQIGRMAQRGQFSPTRMQPRSLSQARQLQNQARWQRRRAKRLQQVRSSAVLRIGSAVLLLAVLTLDGFVWWRSQSYGALFAVVATAVVMLVIGLAMPGGGEGGRRSGAAVLAVVAVAGVVAVVVFRETVAGWFDRDATWSGRTQLWDNTIDVVRERPIRGFGFDGGLGLAGLGTRSGYLQIAVGAGLIGLVALVWVCLVALRRAAGAATSRPDALSVWVAGMVAYGIAANVNESFVTAFSVPWLLLVFGLGHAVRRLEERPDDLVMT